MSIEVHNLTKLYGDQVALDSISFKTGSNHIIGFLGPNGAGKSTTMKILAGIIPSNSGIAKVNGVAVQDEVLAVKSIIGYLPENNPLYLDMFVKEILEYEASVHQIKNSTLRIEEVITLVGLEVEQHKKVSQLSKGYRQRVGLAMAIIHDPKVLILDEPTSGLDPIQILEIRNLIKSLSLHKTVLLSTHILQEVEVLCDEIIIVNKGKIKDHFLKVEQPQKYPCLSIEDIFIKLTTF